MVSHTSSLLILLIIAVYSILYISVREFSN